MSSTIHPARLIAGGLYLLKALLASVMLVLALLGALPGFLANPLLGGLGMAIVVVVLGGCAFVWGAIGLGLLRGNRIALAIAIAFAGLNALGALGGGQVVWFLFEAALFVGLLMSRQVRSAYS